mmetsp:Transcript_16857/g.32900  ORF Transcript_16857/g.32900 Transcript_16857/m.32900 type:complete len:889 (-) Transcript_16857:143-2809(-)
MAGSASSDKKRRKKKRQQLLMAAAAGLDDSDDDNVAAAENDLAAWAARYDEGALSDLTAHVAKLSVEESCQGDADVDQNSSVSEEPAAALEPQCWVLRGLRIHASQAATKRDHVLRNRVLLRADAMAQLAISPGALVTVYKDLEMGADQQEHMDNESSGNVVARNQERPVKTLAAAWPLASLKPGEIQLSKSLWSLFGGAKTCSVERLATGAAQSCTSATLRMHTADPRAAASVKQSLYEPLVKDYVLESLRGEYLSKYSTCGLLLNGYFVNLTVEAVYPPDSVAALVTEHTKLILTTDNTEGETSEVLVDSEGGKPELEDTNQLPSADENEEHSGKGIKTLVGGLQQQVDQVLEVLSLALGPSRASLDIQVPRGVLLHGPPGTGKTLIARSAAHEFNASIHVIHGAEVMSNFVGQAEARISAIFEAAFAQAPAIVFLDEIDALCPARGENAGAESGMAAVHNRVVGVLMQQLDRLASVEGVAVIAASNRPSVVDPALRRPGRLDREVEVGVPASTDRADILRVHLRNFPHDLTTEDMERIAEDMHGYVGADIMMVCREAGWQALLRHVKLDELDATANVDSLMQDVKLEYDDLMSARAKVKPSALREFAVEVPKVYWTDVGGQEDVKMLLREAVEPEFHAAFARMGIRPPQGVLLYGPPGCSKTLLAKAIATECKMNFIAIKGPELFNKWVGESERAVHEVFRKARLAEPTVVFFDEIDALAGSRGAGADSGSGGGVADRVLSQLLTEMDGIEARKRVIVVAATNRPDLVDAALLRPGRLDRLILVRPPDAVARESILRIHTRKMPLDTDVDLKAMADTLTDRFTGAEIGSLCREAAMHALERDENVQTVSQADFEAAADLITPQVTDGMIEFYLDLDRQLNRGVPQ